MRALFLRAIRGRYAVGHELASGHTEGPRPYSRPAPALVLVACLIALALACAVPAGLLLLVFWLFHRAG